MRHFSRPAPRSLALRYALLMGALTIGLLLVSGTMEMLLSYRDARQQLSTLQTLQARAAAAEIEQTFMTVRTVMHSVAILPWGQPGFEHEQRRAELQRLLVLLPSVTDLKVVDRQGRELLRVSRTSPDRRPARPPQEQLQPLPAALSSLASGDFGIGPTFFRDNEQPHVVVAQADAAPHETLTLATLDLRFLGDMISRLRVGDQGQIFLVDAENHLVAHPRATHVLRKLNLGAHEAIRMARESLPVQGTMRALDAVDLEGQEVTTTAVPLVAPGWLLFVEQPRTEVLRPVVATLMRTAGLIALALACGVVASLLFARRMAAPIIRLREATRRISEGDFGSRIPGNRHDELGLLAEDFNRMAEHLEASYAGLEARIVERTRELAPARDAAVRASAAKTRFLATASHDLRQPMHTIGLLVTVLCTELRERQALEVAHKLQACVQLMETLFASLLDLSTLDAGAVRVSPQTFVIGDLLARVVRAFEPQAEQRQLQLRLRPCRGLVHTDAALLERVLTNLIANALQYTAAGKVLVGCRYRGPHLAVQVWDTGPGIPADQQEAIFEEFYRIDAPSAPRTGLGLGLSIVRRSLDLMQHPLHLRSQPGRGSMFELILPRPAEAAVSLWPVVAHSAAESSNPLQGTFALLIDDHEGSRQALESLCLSWGCLVQSATSLAEALDALSKHLRQPDILLCDYHLARGPDGLTAAQELRKAMDGELPCILVTAEQDEAILSRARALGIRLLRKPAGAAVLRQAILQTLEQAPADADADH